MGQAWWCALLVPSFWAVSLRSAWSIKCCRLVGLDGEVLPHRSEQNRNSLSSLQLPALLRPPEPRPLPHVLLQGLGLLLGGSLMFTIALLEEQLLPMVPDG